MSERSNEKLSQREVVLQYLREHPNEKLTARQIAKEIVARFPVRYEEKRQKSQRINTHDELIGAVTAEIGSSHRNWQRRHPELNTTGDQPPEYYYSGQTGSAEVTVAESLPDTTDKSGTKISEQDMYRKLSQFLWKEFKVYSKRIDEKRSSNKIGGKGANRWLYPDVVGVEDLGSDWHGEVKECVKQYSDKRTKLWSFEVKILVNRSNVRECFFQAVSNSSWANFGYLVAAEITGEGTLKELRMLTAVHGIGLLELDAKDLAKSQVIIPAREKVEIDWDSCNRLATENKDFLDYVREVKNLYLTGGGKTWAKFWDAR